MPDPQPRVQPHRFPTFWRLLDLFGRLEHPVALDDFDGDDNAYVKSMQERIAEMMQMADDRVRRYDVFDEMDRYGLVTAILDTYAEESTPLDQERERSVWIESGSEKIRNACEDVLANCMVEESLPQVSRFMYKYGDHARRLVYATDKGVLGWRSVKAATFTRVHDKYERLVGFKQTGQKFHGKSADISWPWDFVHFRMLGSHEDGYGTSMLEAMFRPWRSLALASDAMLMYRLRRTPDRNLIQVNTGTLDDVEAVAYTKGFEKRYRRSEFTDPATRSFKSQFNPLTPWDDIFMPMRPDQESRIDTLSGSGNVGEIADIEYLRDEFFGSAATPKEFFGFDSSGAWDSKAALVRKSIRFARRVKRGRKSLVQGLRTLCDIHLTLLQGAERQRPEYDPSRTKQGYLIRMPAIDALEEEERLELVRLRNEIIQTLAALGNELQVDPRAWATYLLLTYARLPEAVVLRLVTQVPRSDKSTDPNAPDPNGFGGPPPAEGHNGYREPLTEDRGVFEMSPREKRALAVAISTSPRLQSLIAEAAEMAESTRDDARNDRYFHEHGAQQTDPRMLPPRLEGGLVLTDAIAEDKEVTQLNERRKTLTRAASDEPE